MELEHLIFSQGPQRVAPFSHAVRAGEYLFITGQMPTLKNDSTKLVEGGIEEQTHQVMNNLIDVLNSAGYRSLFGTLSGILVFRHASKTCTFNIGTGR